MKLKLRELRIGNIINGIYHDYDDGIDEELELETICKVATLDSTYSGDYSIYVESEKDIEVFSDFEGIKITKEGLIEIGFENTHDENYQAGKIVVEFNEKYTYVYIICPMPWIELDHIEYIHQIQNLYFILEGEELSKSV
jgi:hypothetical protein